MKIQQVVVTGQGQVELGTSELDKNIGDDEILIRTECTFISAGTELANYTGKDPDVFRKGSWCAYPWRAGYANVGIVEAAGAKLSHLNGQRVFTFGPHASYTKIRKESLMVVVPDGIGSDTAAASRMAGVATSAMVMAERRLFQPVVAVFGLGIRAPA